MARREKGGKYGGMSKKGNSNDSKFVEKSPGNYNSRYKGLVSPEKDIVEGPVPPTYKSNRYK